MLTQEQLLGCLRSALNHLYDPDHLRQSPLAALFGVAQRFDTASALQRILTGAIASLEPKSDDPSQAQAWQTYDLLYYRYVQKLTEEQVASQLSICTRHLRRRRRAALQALADVLWSRFELRAGPDRGAAAGTTCGQSAVHSPTANEELAWLREAPPELPTDLSRTLRAVLERARPLAARHGASLEVAPAEGFPSLAAHQLAVKQALLNLVGVAIHRAPHGRVCISARAAGREVEIEVSSAAPDAPAAGMADEDGASLDMAEQLAGLCGGRLTLTADQRAFVARLSIPALEQLTVLAIDDNADTLQLLRRYTSNTRYHLVGTSDPGRAKDLAETLSPQVIVLDVMMPQVDGWEVLSYLREHPKTGHIPIIVCTILPQEDMALSMGAAGFVRKPITRQAFLTALDRQVRLMGPESH